MSDKSHCCRKTRIAESSMASVDLCSCGSVSLNIGPATIRLTTNALGELSTILRAALSHRAFTAELRPPPIPPGLLRGSES